MNVVYIVEELEKMKKKNKQSEIQLEIELPFNEVREERGTSSERDESSVNYEIEY